MSIRTSFMMAAAMASVVIPARAEDDVCRPVVDAMIKLVGTPYHLFTAWTSAAAGGAPRQSETIVTPGAMYVLARGKWVTQPYDGQKEAARIRQRATQGTSQNCVRVRDEAIDGEAAVLYSVKSRTDAGTLETQIWISTTRGLPLKQEINQDLGGTNGKVETRMRFDYANVQPPAGAPPATTR